MNPIIDRCAGLDVHQATVMATVRIPGEGGRQSSTEQFPTTTVGLLTLRYWLRAYGVTHVAMVSTGVYWKPVYYILGWRLRGRRLRRRGGPRRVARDGRTETAMARSALTLYSTR